MFTEGTEDKKIRNDWGDHCVEQRICFHSSVKEKCYELWGLFIT